MYIILCNLKCIKFCFTGSLEYSYLVGGSVDYGYPLPIMYEFTFLAGETCATPIDPIPIIDDRISENDERFKISILKLSLPHSVQTSSRSTATVTIKDNDSKLK